MLLLMFFPGAPLVALGATALGLSACMGWLSWRYIERPALRLKSLRLAREIT